MTTESATKTTSNGHKMTMTVDHMSFGMSFVTLTVDKCVFESLETTTEHATEMFAKFAA